MRTSQCISFFGALLAAAFLSTGCADTDSSTLAQSEREKARGISLDSGECTDNATQVTAAYARQEMAAPLLLLEEPDFDFTRFQNAHGDDRTAMIDERKAQLEPIQDAVEERVQRLGGEVLAKRWLTNQIRVSIPVHNINALFAHASVREMCVGDAPLVDE